MNTFKDIQWHIHRNIPNAIQGHLILESGKELSLAAGPSLYSTPGGLHSSAPVTEPEQCVSFEVAVIDIDGSFVDDVMGWQSRGEINNLILALETPKDLM